MASPECGYADRIAADRRSPNTQNGCLRVCLSLWLSLCLFLSTPPCLLRARCNALPERRAQVWGSLLTLRVSFCNSWSTLRATRATYGAARRGASRRARLGLFLTPTTNIAVQYPTLLTLSATLDPLYTLSVTRVRTSYCLLSPSHARPVNINIPGPSSLSHRKLPPQLIKFGSDELVLAEMQGSLEVDGNKDNQLLGKLRPDPDTVRNSAPSVQVYFVPSHCPIE